MESRYDGDPTFWRQQGTLTGPMTASDLDGAEQRARRQRLAEQAERREIAGRGQLPSSVTVTAGPGAMASLARLPCTAGGVALPPTDDVYVIDPRAHAFAAAEHARIHGLARPQPSSSQPRPPVVSVMGHVDHGKTTLLDTLRRTAVAADEAGGITQSVGAFSVSLGGSAVTFLDTPGHEAFSHMRTAAAIATDLILLCVAAPDGVRPQTKEVLAVARELGLPVVLCITKCDVCAPDTAALAAAMAAAGFPLERDGGDTLSCEISAVKGTGLEQLGQQIALAAELRNPPISAPWPSRAEGVVVETRTDPSGPSLLVVGTAGHFAEGQHLLAGRAALRVRRVVDNTTGAVCDDGGAGPSVPVRLYYQSARGAKISKGDLPAPGAHCVQVKDAAEALQLSRNRQTRGVADGFASANALARDHTSLLDELARPLLPPDVAVPDASSPTGVRRTARRLFNVVVLADTHGSLTAVLRLLAALPVCEVCVRVVAAHVGSAAGVAAAAALAGATLVAFRVSPEHAQPVGATPAFFSALPTAKNCDALYLMASAADVADAAPPNFWAKSAADSVASPVRRRGAGAAGGAAGGEVWERAGFVPVFTFGVVYDVGTFVRHTLERMLPTRPAERVAATVSVLKVYPWSPSGTEKRLVKEGHLSPMTIGGCAVKEGVAAANATLARVIRGGRVVREAAPRPSQMPGAVPDFGAVYSLKQVRVEVASVRAGQECGIMVLDTILEVGDTIELIETVDSTRTLEEAAASCVG